MHTHRKEVVVPSSTGGSNLLPMVHVMALTSFVLDLADSNKPIPKPYLLAAESKPVYVTQTTHTHT